MKTATNGFFTSDCGVYRTNNLRDDDGDIYVETQLGYDFYYGSGHPKTKYFESPDFLAFFNQLPRPERRTDLLPNGQVDFYSLGGA